MDKIPVVVVVAVVDKILLILVSYKDGFRNICESLGVKSYKIL